MVYLSKGVFAVTGLLCAVALVDDFTAPGGHGAEQQGPADVISLGAGQSSDMFNSFLRRHLYILPFASKFQVPLKRHTDTVLVFVQLLRIRLLVWNGKDS